MNNSSAGTVLADTSSLRMLTFVMSLVIGVSISVLNGGIFIIFMVSKTVKIRRHDIIVFSLSFTDLLVGVSIIVDAFAFILTQPIHCAIIFGFTIACRTASGIHTTLISVEKCHLFVNKPVKSGKIRFILIICLTWVLSILFTLIPMVLWVSTNSTDCSFYALFLVHNKSAAMYFSILTLVVMTVFMTSCCTLMVMLCRKKRSLSRVQPIVMTNMSRDQFLHRGSLLYLEGRAKLPESEKDEPEECRRITSISQRDVNIAKLSYSIHGIHDTHGVTESERNELNQYDANVKSTGTGNQQKENVKSENGLILSTKCHMKSVSIVTIERQQKAIYTILIIFLVNFLFMGPQIVKASLEGFVLDDDVDETTEYVLLLVSSLNSLCNPALYVIRIREFRIHLIHLIRRFTRRLSCL